MPMPDIQFFDAAGFFAQKIAEVEQALISKKAELEILYANRQNLESTITSLALLSAEHQRAIQAELASLKEVLNSTERAIVALEGEVEILSNKLSALQAARNLVQIKEV
jgi:chromosome segregation ATPase